MEERQARKMSLWMERRNGEGWNERLLPCVPPVMDYPTTRVEAER